MPQEGVKPVVIHLALDYHRRRCPLWRLWPHLGNPMPNGRTQMNQAIPAKESITDIGERNGLQLAIKHTCSWLSSTLLYEAWEKLFLVRIHQT